MKRVVVVYGAIAGIIAAANIGLIALGHHGSLLVGYLILFVALSFVFFGVKKYRDEHLGGTIRFATALGIGAAISAIACTVYVLTWEAYLYATDYRFMEEFMASTLEAQRAAGASDAQLAQMERDMSDFAVTYSEPAYRLLFTLAEIVPVAILVTLLSAFLLRNSKFLPARRSPD